MFKVFKDLVGRWTRPKPPPKTWQGLTIKEILEIKQRYGADWHKKVPPGG